jgi:RNA polymerase sigma factor (sigma-70 family)
MAENFAEAAARIAAREASRRNLDPEEALSEAMLSLVYAARQWTQSSRKPFRAYATSRIKLGIIRTPKKPRHLDVAVLEVEDERGSQDPDSAYHDAVEAIAELIPEKYRPVCALAWFAGMTQQEVARILGMHQTTVSGHLKAAREEVGQDRIRKILNGDNHKPWP